MAKNPGLRPHYQQAMPGLHDRRVGVSLTLILVALILTPISSPARTWRVAKDGSGDFSTIQPAVNAAAPGDTVFIAAGRYPEFQVTTALGLPEREACVVVSVDNLTFIGESAETVIVGPESYRYWNYGPVGIGAIASLDYMRVEGVGLTNNYDHVHKEGGSFDVRRCVFANGGIGVAALVCDSGLVEDCAFRDCISGIMVHTGRDVLVRNCRFEDCGSQIGGTSAAKAMISTGIAFVDCHLTGGWVGISFDWSTGEIRGCRVEGTDYIGVGIFGRGTEVLIDNTVALGSPHALDSDGLAVVHGNRNVFQGVEAGLYLAQSQVTFRECHFLNGGAWSVRLWDDIRYSPGTYDLTGNWWGTTDTAQIDAWIQDANDNPQIGAVVQYIPFLDHPVGTESKTLGGIKGMFR